MRGAGIQRWAGRVCFRGIGVICAPRKRRHPGGMTQASRRTILTAGVLGLACACAFHQSASAQAAPGSSGKFVCPPCGCAAHDGDKDTEFDKAGACPSCGMTLIPKPEAAKPAPKI